MIANPSTEVLIPNFYSQVVVERGMSGDFNLHTGNQTQIIQVAQQFRVFVVDAPDDRALRVGAG